MTQIGEPVRFESKILGNVRDIWFQEPADVAAANPAGVCVFLDAEYYLSKMDAPLVVSRLQAEGRIPPLFTAYVSHIDAMTRWKESFCNVDFAASLAEELLPWLSQKFCVPSEIYSTIVGLSLTGLSAAHVALCYPNVFRRVVSQSGSFWWNNGWLIEQVKPTDHLSPAFRISVGDQETTEHVDHGNGLIQEESQLSSNRRMRDVLIKSGFPVSYEEYSGGHDIAAWQDDLAVSLATLFDDA